MPTKHGPPREGVYRKVVSRSKDTLRLSCGHSIPLEGRDPPTSTWRVCRVCVFPKEGR